MSSRTTTRKREADELIGVSFGPHRAIAPIAVGGFACVVLASGAGTGGVMRTVALKVLRRHLAEDPEFVAMFRDEARLSSMVRHPNIVPVLEFGESADGRHYLAMEYVVGEPLSAVIPVLCNDRQDIRERAPIVARIIADAAAGLHAAHEALAPDGTPLDLVHRDVAPSNLFVRYDGTTQVIDFGIAKASQRTTRTATGVLKGHFAYMAPEQLRATGSGIDRRVDVWALGVVLWEALAGKRLFMRDEDGATLMAVVHDPVPSPFAGTGIVDEELERVVFGCLARDPNERTSSARAVVEALEAWLARRTTLVTRHSVGDWMRGAFTSELERHQNLLGSARFVEEETVQQSQMRMKDPSGGHAAGAPPQPIAPARGRIPFVTLAIGAVIGAVALASLVGGAALWMQPPPQQAAIAQPAPQPASATQPTAPPIVPPAAAPIAPPAPPVVVEPVTAEAAARRGPPRERGRGFVNVALQRGFGRVFIGRRLLGETPGRFELPAGTHRLRIDVDGNVRTMRVRVRDGQTTRLLVPS